MALCVTVDDCWKTAVPLLYQFNDTLASQISRMCEQGRLSYLKTAFIISNPCNVLCHIKTATTPINLSFYTFLEILAIYDIQIPVTSLFLCEAPGGFIQAMLHKSKQLSYKTYDINASDFHVDIKRSNIIMSEHINDIRKCVNTEYIIDKIQGVDFITADGCTGEYKIGQEETQIFGLLLAQTHVALNTWNNKGTFILRIYQMWQNMTQGLLWYIYLVFENIQFIKPNTFDKCSYVKYVVCTGYNKCLFESKYACKFNSIKSNNTYFEYPMEWGAWLSHIQQRFTSDTEACITKALDIVHILIEHKPFMNQTQLDTIVSRCMNDEGLQVFGYKYIKKSAHVFCNPPVL